MSSGNPNQDVGNPPKRITATSESSVPASTWELEESSLWWLSFFWDPGKSTGWLSNPGNVLMLTSVPFFAGAYFGYRMPTERLEDLIQGSVGNTGSADVVESSNQKKVGASDSSKKRTKSSIKAVDQDAIRVVAARTASKALRIATLGTVGTFGFVGAMGFYMSGYKSLGGAVAGTTSWASSLGKSMERAMGGDQAVSKTHPEVLATKHMNEEEELSYIYDNYIKEEDDNQDTLWEGDDVQQSDDKGSTPTLYAVYKKYFKTEEND